MWIKVEKPFGKNEEMPPLLHGFNRNAQWPSGNKYRDSVYAIVEN
jgi:hypothetical protein